MKPSVKWCGCVLVLRKLITRLCVLQDAVTMVPSDLPASEHDHRFQPHMFNMLVDQVPNANPISLALTVASVLQKSGEVTGITAGNNAKLPAWTKRHLAFKEAKRKEEEARREIEERKVAAAAEKKALATITQSQSSCCHKIHFSRRLSKLRWGPRPTPAAPKVLLPRLEPTFTVRAMARMATKVTTPAARAGSRCRVM